MCTAAVYKTKDFYFGRNLDYEFPYGEEVTVTPRNYPFHFRFLGEMEHHYAMIGMAHIQNDYPLYYDAVNEKGLCIAGLNFVGNAVYPPVTQGVASVPQYALIPWLLATVAEARNALARVVVDNTPFAPALPCAQLHWLVADRSGCIVVEATADGLHVYDDPVGVLTNNPPFPQQLAALRNYTRLSPSRRPILAACPSRSTAAAWARSVCRATCRRPRGSCARRSCAPMPARRRRRTRASASFSTSSRAWSSSAAAASWTTASMRSRSIPAAATRTGAFITTRPMITARSPA